LARNARSDVGVIVAAGGRSHRFGRKLPKQFQRLGQKSVLAWSLERFSHNRSVRSIVVVVPEEYLLRASRVVRAGGFRKVHAIVSGGRERQGSVARGLQALGPECRLVLVHDAARPLIDPGVIRGVIEGARRFGAAMAAVRVRDTIKRERRKRFSGETLPRELLWAAQTPQGFRRELLEGAHRRAKQDGFVGTDEASLVERLGHPVRIVEGSSKNLKITDAGDLSLARWYLRVGG